MDNFFETQNFFKNIFQNRSGPSANDSSHPESAKKHVFCSFLKVGSVEPRLSKKVPNLPPPLFDPLFGPAMAKLGQIFPKKGHNFFKIANFFVPERTNPSGDPRGPIQTHLEVF